jgi:hypothetical protein
MSDTSGFGGFGPATRGIRGNLEITFGPTVRTRSTKKKRPAPTDRTAPVVSAVVWQPLHNDKLLEKVLLPVEILYYLKAMARFIDGAKSGGLKTVVDEFGLRDESNFPSLRRSIASRAPGNSESGKEGSEQHSRAGGAFNTGSARWAQKISGVTNPTGISILQLVGAIRSSDRYDEALLLSARRILQEYGESVIRALIKEDDPWAATATRKLIEDFHAQLNQFFAEHGSAEEWNASRIAGTLKEFPAFVRD